MAFFNFVSYMEVYVLMQPLLYVQESCIAWDQIHLMESKHIFFAVDRHSFDNMSHKNLQVTYLIIVINEMFRANWVGILYEKFMDKIKRPDRKNRIG